MSLSIRILIELNLGAPEARPDAFDLSDALSTEGTLEDGQMDFFLPPSRAERAAALIHQTQGRIFGATVKTRSGAERTFNAKITRDSFNERDERNGTVLVHEMNSYAGGFRGAFRTIALDGVRTLTIDGRTYDLDAEYGTLPYEMEAAA